MKEKGHRVHEMVVPSVVKAVVGNRLARANSASHGPRVSKERSNPKENPKVPKLPQACTIVKPRRDNFRSH